MNYYRPTRITNQRLGLWLVALSIFLSHCSPKGMDTLTNGNNSNQGWYGVPDAEIKKKFKAFIGEWEGMTYDNFLNKVAQAATKQAAYKDSFKKNGGTVSYYIPTEYIPSEDEKIVEKLKRGPFYQVPFKQEYSKIGGKLKKIYDTFLILPEDKFIRSKDASLFVVACFLKFTENVDKALKQIDIDNDALIKELNKLLNDFRSETQAVDRRSSQYPNKNVYQVAMGMVIVPNSDGKISFAKNTEANYFMNERCLISKKLALFTYEQCKEITMELDKLANALKATAAKRAAQTEA